MTIEYKDSKRIITSPSSATSVQGYSQLNAGTNGWNIASGASDGERLSLQIVSGSSIIADPIKEIKMKLSKNSSPTDTFYVRVRNSSDTILAEASMDSSTISASLTEYTFTLNTGVILAQGDRINAEYTGSSGSGNVSCGVNNATEPSTVNCQKYDGSSYSDIDRTPDWQFDSSPSTTISILQDKPTDVQDNSILVEKDTARRYWKSSSSDLKTYYKFEDNGANSATTEEGLGSSADMTVTGATYVTGKVGSKAISFDGTNDYSVIGSSTSDFNFLANTTHEWTVAFWLKNDDFSSLGMILSTSVELGSSRYGLGIRAQSSGSMYVHFSNGTNTNRFTTTQTGFSTDGNWHFIVITAKKSDSTNSLEFWQDGTSLGTASNSGKDFVDTNASQAPYIGQAGDSSQYLDGALDELSIWNRRLSDSEIATLYNSGTGLAVDSVNLRKITWTMEPTYRDDFSSDNGTEVGSIYSVSGGKLTGTSNRSSGYKYWAVDLGTTLSNTAWIIDFDIDFTSISLSSGYGAYNAIQLTSTKGTDGIGLSWIDQTVNSRFYVQKAGSNTPNFTTTISTTGGDGSGKYYVRLIRDGGTFYARLYSNSARTTLIEEEEISITSTGLRHFQINNYNNSPGTWNANVSFEIDNLKFYNGVTSIN